MESRAYGFDRLKVANVLVDKYSTEIRSWRVEESSFLPPDRNANECIFEHSPAKTFR